MKRTRAVGIAILASALGACSNSSGPSTTGRQVTFQAATKPAPAAPAPGLNAAIAAGETIKLGSDSIVIDQVQLVLRRIELNKQGAGACDTMATTHDCEELELGPVLLDLPLGAGAQHQFSVAVDTGSYGEIQFEIHRPEAGSDAAFLQANPTFDGVSIRATGTFNGAPFTYTSDLDVNQEHSFNPPLAVTDTTGAQLTLLVDLSTWFVNQAGTALVDPATALVNQPNEGLVRSNIEASFHAFEDENHDGRDDHSLN